MPLRASDPQHASPSSAALPFPADTFDVATMALVISFVPDPIKGVTEMARVVRPGGTVAAYVWDMLGGGYPWEPICIEMRAMGLSVLNPSSQGALRIEALYDLWTRTGLDAVETRDITVQRTLADFDDFWTISLSASSAQPTLAAMAPNDIELLKACVRACLPVDATRRITYSARANAVASAELDAQSFTEPGHLWCNRFTMPFLSLETASSNAGSWCM